jgi:hypothetical protein
MNRAGVTARSHLRATTPCNLRLSPAVGPTGAPQKKRLPARSLLLEDLSDAGIWFFLMPGVLDQPVNK